MNHYDTTNFEKLKKSFGDSNFNVVFEDNDRETESLYRFGWFYINNYKYNISAWSFQKNIVTFESINGLQVKYNMSSKLTTMNTFKQDTLFVTFQRKIRNGLADFLKDLSDKLRT